ELTPADLPALEPEITAVHVGTLALATDPPATAYELLIERESKRRLVFVDPNIRPAVAGDRDAYRPRFERWAGLAHVIKLSADDAEWLYPGVSAEDVAALVLALGAQLVIVTLGADGAIARSRSGRAGADSLR